MSSRTTALRLVAVVLSLATFASAEERPAGPEYFPVQVGNAWHYAVEVDGQAKGNVISKIAKIEKIDDQALIRLESIAGGKVVNSEHMRVEETGLFRCRFNGIEATPPVCVIKFPVKKEDMWNIESTLGAEKVTGTCRQDMDEITVPAGQFKTVRIMMEASSGSQQVETTYWYAEKVGMVQQTMKLNGISVMLKLEKFEQAEDEKK